MSTARMTFGTVLGTVSDAAVAVSTVLGTGIKGIQMLDQYVSDASDKQKLRSLVDMESFEVRLVEEIAMEDTERQLKLKEFMSKSQDTAELFKLNHDRITKLIADRKTK